MDTSTFAQIQAARLAHFNATEPSTNQAPIPETQQVTTHRVKDTDTIYQRCGGGRRVIRKKIGGN